MKRPRKRITQTLAEKNGGKLYAWTKMLDSYCFTPAPDVWATIKPIDGKFLMTVSLNKQRYVGERKTLDEAFKATANLVYKHAREYWLKMDGRAVSADFEDFLKGEI